MTHTTPPTAKQRCVSRQSSSISLAGSRHSFPRSRQSNASSQFSDKSADGAFHALVELIRESRITLARIRTKRPEIWIWYFVQLGRLQEIVQQRKLQVVTSHGKQEAELYILYDDLVIHFRHVRQEALTRENPSSDEIKNVEQSLHTIMRRFLDLTSPPNKDRRDSHSTQLSIPVSIQMDTILNGTNGNTSQSHKRRRVRILTKLKRLIRRT
ncbi:hypothetical protein B0T21DRAFT_359770 [Apiosordaria backusii]|uniref:Uncharacterized protein n=1 Tax=Apiosordaria backusii TaxID=314023 RepID=A0AA40ELN5_9PEZI|nr:hypothetical protein B0T21DRAFT_359770 [Apiosordaria backusii]